MSSQVVGSSFVNGAQFPNYVNGRLLAAEDLATGQSTLTQRDGWMGQAAGTGIVNGLWVANAATSVTVAPGLGITPSGEPVSLAAPVTLPLSVAGSTAAPGGGSFANCTAASSGPQPAVGPGAYLLTALPALQLQGQAPLATPSDSATPAGCTAQWEVEGVQFKVIALPTVATVDGIAVTDDNRQNLLAHWCLGTQQLTQLPVQLFGFNPAYRGLDQLASSDLTPCDLPLCIFYWDNGSITFVDNWAARRRVTRPDISTTPWPSVMADHRQSDGEARFLQFQGQVGAIVAQGASQRAVAADTFGLLPPVGFLPIANQDAAKDVYDLYSDLKGVVLDEVNLQTDTTTAGVAPSGGAATSAGAATSGGAAAPAGTSTGISLISRNLEVMPGDLELIGTVASRQAPASGFVPATFFGSLARFGGFLSWEMTYFALRQSWFMAAVPTATTETEGEDSPSAITYYYVLENYSAVTAAVRNQTTPVAPYLVFVADQVWAERTQPPFQAANPYSDS